MVQRSYGCPVEFGVDLLGGKWKLVILAHLKTGPKSYGELRRLIPAISDKMLTARLHDLTELSFAVRRAEGSRTSYALSDRGHALRPLLQALFDWGQLEASRRGVTIEPLHAEDPPG